MQCVILAGGLGTRMRPLTDTCPKTLLPVCGHPFAYHQLHCLAAQGVTEVIYAIGHQGELIREYWLREQPPVPSIRFVDEGVHLRGTGGANHLALEESVVGGTVSVIYRHLVLP